MPKIVACGGEGANRPRRGVAKHPYTAYSMTCTGFLQSLLMLEDLAFPLEAQ